MNENEFREAVQAGLGRGILYARKHDVRAFRDVVLDACLHCHSVDPQCEGTRAPYMFDLVNAAGERAFYRDEIVNSLPACGDDWDTVQRYRLASYLAMDGDDRVRQAMYSNFDAGPRFAEEMGVDFVQMDGMDGFLFAAGKVGALLLSGSAPVDMGHLLWHATERFGEQEIFDALRKAGETNRGLEAYRIASESSRTERGHRSSGRPSSWESIQGLSYEELKPKLSETSAYWLGKWGTQAGTDDLESAARDLARSESPVERTILLRLFGGRAFSLDPAPLLALAVSDDTRAAIAAAKALAQVTHPEVRECAYRLVDAGRAGRQEAIAMLAQNFEAGDHQTVLGWFEREADRHVRHSMGSDLRKFWERRIEPASEVRMLATHYERGPCSMCREFVVRRLIELDALSASLRDECAYDASEEVRKLVGGQS